MLKFLIDNSSGKKLATALKNQRYDVIYAGDILSDAEDEEVLEKAEKEGRILITNDKDFGELIFRHKKPSSGVILLRLKIDFPNNRIRILGVLIKKFGTRLKKRFIVVSEDKFRIKKL